LSKERAQRGDSPVAGIRQHRFHGSLAVGRLLPVNGRTSSGMDAALAQDALERLLECAAGIAGRSQPEVLRASALVAPRDPERRRRPTLDDAAHRFLQQTILTLFRPVGAEKKCIP
jgi:hypothetical protein